jgi:hypothetical protein
LAGTAPPTSVGAMANTNQRVGRFGEWLAAEHLVDSGMELVDRNWRCPLGEIDIIARDGETVVFCEVKTRRGPPTGRRRRPWSGPSRCGCASSPQSG